VGAGLAGYVVIVSAGGLPVCCRRALCVSGLGAAFSMAGAALLRGFGGLAIGAHR
jgi:hypothetical protein